MYKTTVNFRTGKWYSPFSRYRYTFLYEDSGPWEKKPLTTYNRVQEVPYTSSLQEITLQGEDPHTRKPMNFYVKFPNTDFFVPTTRLDTPLLVTGPHSKLLYYLINGELNVQIRKARTLILFDEHHDIYYGNSSEPFTPTDINVGNWVTAAVLAGVIDSVLHINSANLRENRDKKDFVWQVPYRSGRKIEVPYTTVPVHQKTLVMPALFNTLSAGNEIIASFDSDAFASRDYPSFVNPGAIDARRQRFAEYISIIAKNSANLSLVHYCTSPEWNPFHEQVWDFFSDQIST